MTKPIDAAQGLRPVEDVRADLAHPHTAALTALHSTTTSDGPIGRLLRDVGPLLAEVERAADWERQADEHYANLIAAQSQLSDAPIAEQECADFWDAMDKARSVLDEALSNARQRDQARARAQIAAVAFPQPEGAPS